MAQRQFKFLRGAESRSALDTLEEFRGPEQVTEIVIVRSESATVDDGEFESTVETLVEEISALGPEIVTNAVSFFDTGAVSQVSEDRRTTVIPVQMAGGFEGAEDNIQDLHDVLEESALPGGYEVFIFGEATFSLDFLEGNQSDLERGESFAIPLALIILAVVFGALAVVFIPILLAIISMIIAIGTVSLISIVFELNAFVQNIITMIGLAVGIDYALFIVSRFREERQRGREKIEAIAMAGATAGRAVFFSGLTVVFALIGLLIIPQSVFVSLGIGAITVVIVAVLATLTLLPATLSIMGDKVNRFKVPFIKRRELDDGSEHGGGGFWAWTTRGVMRQPWVALIVSAAFLIAATVPFFGINLGSSGVEDLPDNFQSKQGFEVLKSEFGFIIGAPAEIVIDGDVNDARTQEAIANLTSVLAGDAAFGPASEATVSDAGDFALITVPLSGGAQSAVAVDGVRRLRDDYVPTAFAGAPVEAFVGGLTSEEIDLLDTTSTYQPWVIALVLGLSFILLTMVFRSIVVPIKAIIMNLLSVGAAYGILVLVFQEGFLNEVFGLQQTPVIQPWLPLMLFTILFGLSMDYQVFLISRIREKYDETGKNASAVAFGVRSTAGLITGAALIMVAVFGGFAAGDLITTSQFGFGLAVAILIDATIVRSVLVPSTMKLLGDRNWYLPSFLHWIPDVRVEGGSSAPESVSAVAGGDD
ncbi:MAG: MMPL family transporter [Chloroflexi bacterium]|nr:MMPL family transporter [Chloroflexota bacterium]MBT5318419.1 MMPL family transporter [Chloroflexota bacterium]